MLMICSAELFSGIRRDPSFPGGQRSSNRRAHKEKGKYTVYMLSRRGVVVVGRQKVEDSRTCTPNAPSTLFKGAMCGVECLVKVSDRLGSTNTKF